MNKRTKELAEQAGLSIDKYGLAWDKDNPREDGVDLERFAELVEQWARADEREACAKLCESKMIDEYATGKVDHNEQAWTDYCAAAIRQRGEQP